MAYGLRLSMIAKLPLSSIVQLNQNEINKLKIVVTVYIFFKMG